MKLSASEFNAVTRRLAVQDQARRMARAVLVDGLRVARVAHQFGVSRQATHRAARRVWNAYLETVRCPEGWEVVKVKLPRDLAAQVRAMERDAVDDYLTAQT